MKVEVTKRGALKIIAETTFEDSFLEKWYDKYSEKEVVESLEFLRTID